MENEDHYVEQTFDSIQQILEAIKTQDQPIKITPEVMELIEKLEKNTKMIKEEGDNFIKRLVKLTGIDEKELLESQNLKSSDKQLLKRAQNIRQDALAIRFGLEKARKRSAAKGRSKASSGQKKQMKERRKLFKSIGGDNKWIPL